MSAAPPTHADLPPPKPAAPTAAPPATPTPPTPWIEGGIALLDADRRVVRITPNLLRWFQDQDSNPLGHPLDSLLASLVPAWETAFQPAWTAPDSHPFFPSQIADPRHDPPAWYDAELTRHPTGWTWRLQSVLPPLADLAEAPWNLHLADASAQRRMFVRLLRAEAQLNQITRSLPGVVFSQHADFSFRFVSPRILDLTGIPADQWTSQSLSFWDVVHEADADELQQQCRRTARNREGLATDFRLRNLRTGKVSHILEHREAIVSAAGLVIGYEGFWLDVTRQKIAERRLSSAAWKETLATLTMGLAHDFSNILAGILSLTDSFRAQIDASHPFAEGLGLIRHNTWQACQLVQRIMNLHRCKTGEQAYHDLNEAVAELADLVQRVLPRRITIQTEFASQTLPLYVDVVELRQVILNLALNAAEAMPQRGRLTFRTELCTQAQLPPHAQGSLPPLPCVCLRTRDTGCGIAPRHLPFIFDPFFTTKPVNKGSGLGLYNARLFVEKHRGAISVESHENQGTDFCLWLPLADFSESERVQSAVFQHRPSVLLAGDPGVLHDSTAEFLRVQGFYVMPTFAPDCAQDALTAEDNHFRAIMILAGPADTAWLALARQIPALLPDLKLVLQLVGSESDAVPADLLPKIHLLITSNMSEDQMVRSLKLLFD